MSTTITAFNESINFWWGCVKVSPECDSCYAESDCSETGRGEKFHRKFGWKLTGPAPTPFRIWGKDAPRLVVPAESVWERALKWDRTAALHGRRIRVFANSMSDFFEKRPDLQEAREQAWEIIRATPNLDWCLLTKRHENIVRCLPEDFIDKPWPNVWLGVSVGTQKMANARLDHLVPIMQDLKPAVFWLSIEPLLEEVHLEKWLDSGAIKWAFAGAESDQEPRIARPTHTAWGESVVEQFQSRNIPIHWKQWGSWERTDKFQAGKENIVMGRDGTKISVRTKIDFDERMKTTPEPCAMYHVRKAYAVNDEIGGKQVWEFPRNYVNWDDYPEWNVKARVWSEAGLYKPVLSVEPAVELPVTRSSKTPEVPQIRSSKADFRFATSPNGHPTHLLKSWLQKSVRRARDEDAAYCAVEFDLAGFSGATWNTLRRSVSEDIGLAEPDLILEFSKLHDEWGKQKSRDHKKAARTTMRAVLLCCRVRKSRLVDNILTVLYRQPDARCAQESLLQEAINQGRDEDAVRSAVALDLAGHPDAAWDTLQRIAEWDISWKTDPSMGQKIHWLRQSWKEDNDDKHHPQRLYLVHATLLCSFAKSDRLLKSALPLVSEADVDKSLLFYKKRPKRAVPDWALDLHTGEGRKMGRGYKHFFEHGAMLVNKAPIDDPYEEQAKAILIATEDVAPKRKPRVEQTIQPVGDGWRYIEELLKPEEATELYNRMLAEPWKPQDTDKFAIHYGRSYNKVGSCGPRPEEILEIPDFLKTLTDRVSEETGYPINYVQAHRHGPSGVVGRHCDPRGMYVPMIVVGQERTFLVGAPEHEVFLRHGSLLIFDGGKTPHSMGPAKDDARFEQNGFDWRISILFRFTTEAMRKYGPGKANQYGAVEQYETAVKEWQDRLLATAGAKS